jgi:long-chain acyl-CoA synthetase
MILHDATTLNVAQIVDQHARLRPDQEAIVFDSTRLTYRQFNAYANRVANALRSLGIGRGDKVALSCPNLPYFPVVYFGILKAGAAVVALNVLLKPREIAYHLKDSDAKAYFVFEGTPELPMGEMGKAGFDEAGSCEHLIVMTANPAAPSPIAGARSLGELIFNQPDTCETCLTRPDDTAVILYTSGTTGQPKGAELTHLNVLLNSVAAREVSLPVLDTSEGARNVTLITLPLFHATGQICQMTTNLYGGGTVVLLARFDPAAVIETMKREQVNVWTGVPTMYWALLRYAEANQVDLSDVRANLRVTTSGGAPMPVEVMREFSEVFGVRVLEGYGLSETSPLATFNHLQLPSKPGTVGQPIFGVEIRCVDDDDNPVPTGTPGEVVIRGHNVMKGYYKRPEATAEAIRNGWFHTGDVGVLDADGYLSIVDRKKDMVLRGGMNVYPRELEEVLMTHPGVSLVAVIGVPDERLGEEVKACVVPKPGVALTEAEVIEWCKERMAAYKYPRYVEFYESLPVSATGKILKRELREMEKGKSGG